MKLKISHKSIIAGLFVLAVALMQTSKLHLISYILIWLGFLISFTNQARTGGVQRTQVFLFFAALFFVTYHVRPSTITHGYSYLGLIALLPLIPSVCFLSKLNDQTRVFIFKSIIAVSVSLGCLLILMDAMSMLPNFIFEQHYAGIRWVGGFNGPNELGMFFVLIIALSMGMFRERQIGTFWLLCSVSVSMFIIYNTYSRGAILSLLVLSLLFFSWPEIQRSMLVLLVFISVISIGNLNAIVSIIEEFTAVRERATDRSEIVDAVFKLLSDKPFFGGGLGYYDVANLTPNSTSHSDLFELLVSGGVLSLSVYLIFYGFILLLCLRRGMITELYFFTAFLCTSLTWNNLLRFKISIMFFIILHVFLCQLLFSEKRKVSLK